MKIDTHCQQAYFSTMYRPIDYIDIAGRSKVGQI